MIDVSRVINSPRLCQDFTVYRRVGAWQTGEFIETETALTLSGIVVPPSAKEIMQLPEADRATGVMMFYSESEMFVTRDGDDPGTSDQAEWRGSRYRISNVLQMIDYGYYQATGVYMGVA
jgi:hypothetical protein